MSYCAPLTCGNTAEGFHGRFTRVQGSKLHCARLDTRSKLDTNPLCSQMAGKKHGATRPSGSSRELRQGLVSGIALNCSKRGLQSRYG